MGEYFDTSYHALSFHFWMKVFDGEGGASDKSEGTILIFFLDDTLIYFKSVITSSLTYRLPFREFPLDSGQITTCT